MRVPGRPPRLVKDVFGDVYSWDAYCAMISAKASTVAAFLLLVADGAQGFRKGPVLFGISFASSALASLTITPLTRGPKQALIACLFAAATASCLSWKVC